MNPPTPPLFPYYIDLIAYKPNGFIALNFNMDTNNNSRIMEPTKILYTKTWKGQNNTWPKGSTRIVDKCYAEQLEQQGYAIIFTPETIKKKHQQLYHEQWK